MSQCNVASVYLLQRFRNRDLCPESRFGTSSISRTHALVVFL